MGEDSSLSVSREHAVWWGGKMGGDNEYQIKSTNRLFLHLATELKKVNEE